MPDARCDLGAATQRSYGNPGQSDRTGSMEIEKAWRSAASDKMDSPPRSEPVPVQRRTPTKRYGALKPILTQLALAENEEGRF